jgi:hypothetical protein
MLLNPGCAIHVRHPWHAKFLVGGVLVVCVQDAIWHVLHLPLQFLDLYKDVLVTMACLVPFQFVVALMVLKMVEQRMNMSERIEHFCFNEAKCHNEADRDSVLRNITAFMKYHGHIDTGASDIDIIQHFESMIHCKLPKLFDASLGRVGFPYDVAACVSLPYVLQSIDYFCTGLHDSKPLKFIIFKLAYPMTLSFATTPLSLAIQFSIARWLIMNCHFGHRTRVSILGIIGVTSTFGPYALLKLTANMAWQGGSAEVSFFVILVVFFCLAAFYYYRPTWYKKHHRRLNAACVA